MKHHHLTTSVLCKPPFGDDLTGRIDAARQTLRAAMAILDLVFVATESRSFDSLGARYALEGAAQAIRYAESLLSNQGE